MNFPTHLRDKIAQLLFVRIGSNMPPAKRVNEDEARILGLIQDWAIGGLCLFNGQYPAASETLKQLQKAAKFPLLVGTDMERGVGQQMRPATVFPHVMAFQAMGTADEAVALVMEFGRMGAREALSMGVHIAFAPVADVSRNPKNPIIATRAFSTSPDEAGRLVEAFIRSSRAEGLLTCPKHFPGHGNTDQDSHEELAQVS
ncbi:MAG TPA: glycoside hydrolase family 3 N-terminal domain-containing protein, partial [Rhodothermales bacterium]|nr:glycoside hydrolase family 3 N-terminal domain-containing protein [Rhodothermales bacterium]